MTDQKAPALAIWALGLTQIIGYGTLYYSYSLLAPDAARELGLPLSLLFAFLSGALLLSAFLAPSAGTWTDRHGAPVLMAAGSLAATVSLLWTALVPGTAAFAIGIVAMQVSSCFVLYSSAFIAIVQFGGSYAQRSITHLTLIGGFASTVFWPLTTELQGYFTWREILLIFAAMHLLICMPLHYLLPRHGSTRKASRVAATSHAVARPSKWSPIFVLLLVGFALEGFVLGAVLVQMVPLLTAVGLGTAAVAVGALFGPAQVASRLLNMVFGSNLPQTWLAAGATAALASGLAVLLLSAPSLAGAVAFSVLFGVGSGLMSIVGGTLPLELFGRRSYGTSVGWITAARQLATAIAPFAVTAIMDASGVFPTLGFFLAFGLTGVFVFGVVVALASRKLATVETTPSAGSEML
ncbi:MAG TPA: arsenite efflux MFS transporter ArsK [Rhizobiaceae bacterium]|nr:arsenite efflux MFS transporter ArsK [Rhizobiaceae bacterium]